MERTCEICFNTFEGSANQKYCAECGKNPDRARKRYAKAVRQSKANAGVYDTPTAKNCKYCGREFGTLFGADFCSKDCRNSYLRKIATCTHCGVNLLEKGVTLDRTTGGVRFCSDECKQAYYERQRVEREKRRKKNTRICPICKKPFDNTNKFYCSKICQDKAREQGYNPAEQETYRAMRKCRRCGNAFELLFDSQHYCGACDRLLHAEMRAKEQAKKKQEQAEKEAKRKQQAEQEWQEKVRKNGLCFYCQTTYGDCERMQTNFVYYPKGAVVEKGKVLSCPTFTETQKGVNKNKKKKEVLV